MVPAFQRHTLPCVTIRTAMCHHMGMPCQLYRHVMCQPFSGDMCHLMVSPLVPTMSTIHCAPATSASVQPITICHVSPPEAAMLVVWNLPTVLPHQLYSRTSCTVNCHVALYGMYGLYLTLDNFSSRRQEPQGPSLRYTFRGFFLKRKLLED
jgi:hypothetical protein